MEVAPHVVVLVHGIRDFALCQETVGRSLSEGGFRVEFTNYGRFGSYSFINALLFEELANASFKLNLDWLVSG